MTETIGNVTKSIGNATKSIGNVAKLIGNVTKLIGNVAQTMRTIAMTIVGEPKNIGDITDRIVAVTEPIVFGPAAVGLIDKPFERGRDGLVFTSRRRFYTLQPDPFPK